MVVVVVLLGGNWHNPIDERKHKNSNVITTIVLVKTTAKIVPKPWFQTRKEVGIFMISRGFILKCYVVFL